MKINGKLIQIDETKKISNSFQKREFVVEYAENPQYPEYLKFELIQDKCGLLDNFSIDQEIEIHFNLKGRKWTDPQGEVKYFNSLQAWRITVPETDRAPSGQPGQEQSDGLDAPPAWLSEDDDSDTPF